MPTTYGRLTRYLLPEWRRMTQGILFMAGFALFSGVSIGLALPVIDKVFVRAKQTEPEGPALHVADGLRDTGAAVTEAFRNGPGVSGRFHAAKDAALHGLVRTQNRAAPLEILTWLCGVTLVSILLKNACDYGRRFKFIQVEQGVELRIRSEAFEHVLALPLAEHQRHSTGQILSRLVADVALIKQYTITTGASLVHHLLQAMVFLGLAVLASPRLALASLVIVPPLVIVTGRLSSKLRKHAGRVQEQVARITSVISEMLTNIRIVKGFGAEELEAERFHREGQRYRRQMVRLMSLDNLAAPISEFWGVMIGVGVMYYGGKLVLDPQSSMTPGTFIVFLLALVSMLHPLKILATTLTTFQRGAAAAQRVFEILDLPAEADAPGAKPVDGLRQELRFDNVSFAYEPGRPVLQDISFVTPAGTTTALVGPSGAGKSTLADLIPRFRDPDTGSVTLDGADLRALKRKDLRKLTGIVTQETILFNDTVAANIAYGSPGAAREQVVEAARTANAHGFIEELPRGYDTVIGERGLRLSGGQRQRIAIARALLRNPPILILDEATSSLDTESEVAVQEALDRLLEHRTTLVIAHRLSTILHADQILVLDRGRIVERGTHAELLSRGPTLYRRLYELQFRDEAAALPG